MVGMLFVRTIRRGSSRRPVPARPSTDPLTRTERRAVLITIAVLMAVIFTHPLLAEGLDTLFAMFDAQGEHSLIEHPLEHRGERPAYAWLDLEDGVRHARVAAVQRR
jgi:hypothetical protein